MTASFQICIDCADPHRLARFWASALGYVLAPPPEGHASWDDYWREVGVPEEDLGIGADSIVDPDGHGPRIWFPVVPEGKTIKNRLHLDIMPADRTQGEEITRLTGLGARIVSDRRPELGWVILADPEGNEFCVEISVAELEAAQAAAAAP